MANKTPEVLRQEIEEGKKQAPIGSLWAHFKSPDKYYEVVDLIIYEDTGEVDVVYKSTFEPTTGISFVATLEKFLGFKETETGKVKRFVMKV
jgi:hypothetical protein